MSQSIRTEKSPAADGAERARGRRAKRWGGWALVALVLGVLLGWSPGAWAQSGGGTALALTVEQAIALGQKGAPSVRVAERLVGEAQASRVGAGVILPQNPRLSVDVRPPLRQGTWNQTGYAASLDLLFEVGGAPGARIAEAQQRVQLARSELAVEQFYAGVQAWKAYLSVQVAEQRVTEMSKAVIIGERVLSASRQRIQVGAGNDIDEATALVQLSEMQTELQAAQRDLAIRQMELRQVLGLGPGQALRLVSDLTDPPEASSTQELMDRAVRNRPELAAIRQRLRLLVATDERLRREVLPRVGVYGGVDASPLSPMMGILGLSVELPVAQRNQGPRAQVARARETEQTRLLLELQAIERQVLGLRSAYESHRSQLLELRQHAIPAAERNLALLEAGWSAGRFDLFRVTSATRDLARVRSRFLDVLEAAWMDRVSLAQAAGGWK